MGYPGVWKLPLAAVSVPPHNEVGVGLAVVSLVGGSVVAVVGDVGGEVVGLAWHVCRSLCSVNPSWHAQVYDPSLLTQICPQL